jgi:hypothetical protein
MTRETKFEKQRRLLLTEAGDTNPLDPEYVSTLVEVVSLCVKREQNSGSSKIDVRERLEPLSLDEFLRTALRHRSVSLIARHATLPEGWVARFKAQEKNIAIASIQNLRQVDYLHKQFDQAGIPHVFLKGCGVSLVAVGRLGLRDAPTDVDILVSEKDTIKAHTLLLRLGFSAHMGATPEKPRIWKQMLFAYPELAYTKDAMTVDLHWRPAHQPDLFPPSEALIAEANSVSHASVTFPTLNTSHALWLEALKMLQDRNFSLSISLTIAFLRGKAQEPTALSGDRIGVLVASAEAFCSEVLGHQRVSFGESLPGKLETSLAAVHSKNWRMFSAMGMRFPSHRKWEALPPPAELMSRLRTLQLAGEAPEGLSLLGIQLFLRPYERYAEQDREEMGVRYRGLIQRGLKGLILSLTRDS